jgi:hypothetical protein
LVLICMDVEIHVIDTIHKSYHDSQGSAFIDIRTSGHL